jgi:uncharacterized protein (TIGR01244 family)
LKRALSALLLAAALAGACAHRPPGLAGSGRGGAADSAAVVALLGGTQNAACPLPGVATGGQPDSARFAGLAAAGFRTVIDLRMPDEPRGYDEPAAARAAGLEYRSLPVSPATLSDSTFDAFRALMKDRRRTPALVHCHSGNRVGALLVPWLVLDRHWSEERAVATAEAGGLRTPALKEKALDYVKRRTAR